MHKITLRFRDEQLQRLEEMKNTLGQLSSSDVVRDALAVYDILAQAKDSGAEPVIKSNQTMTVGVGVLEVPIPLTAKELKESGYSTNLTDAPTGGSLKRRETVEEDIVDYLKEIRDLLVKIVPTPLTTKK